MKKVLIIDDSLLSRNMFKRALGDQYTYIEAVDGVSGLEKYYLEKPDLVILDLTMPGTGGFDVLAQIKQLNQEARVIMGSADIQETSRQQAMHLGAVDFITKPFIPEKVRDIIERALNEPGLNNDPS
ncbi:MAG TPA: response regulator [Anaerolineales bacterium]